jgi:hypothetical protein
MKKLFISSIVLLAFFTGCGSNSCCQGEGLVENKIDLTGNITPIADFKDLEIVSDGTECRFTADATGSTDSDGSVSSYTWTINDTEVSTSLKPTNTPFPCAATIKEPVIVCLIVTDDNDASSLPKCKTVDVVDNSEPEPEPKPELLEPTAVINFTKISGEEAYMFNCDDSHDNDNIDSDNNPANDSFVVNCHWSVFKTDISGSTIDIPHEKDDFLKWVLTSADQYIALQITLTVTDDDNQTGTTTKTYDLTDQ